MPAYRAWNAAQATTAPQSAVTTGTATKTMLQIATPSTRMLRVISWGFTTAESPGADGVIELLAGDVAATVTAHSASGVQPLDPGSPASLMTLGTSATGFTATVEGTLTATRTFDQVAIDSSLGVQTYAYQFTPEEQPLVAVSKFLRIRATTPTTGILLRCWICWDE